MINPLVGYHPADVISALGPEVPERALFTTFTFSPGAFQQQYLTPLLQQGCGNIVVLADRMGYAQSLFAAAAVQGIGTDYRLRQVSAPGAFHGKLVLIRTRSSMVVGVGSGNLTASGLQTNAEVGALYVADQGEQLAQLDNLMLRLESGGLLNEQKGDSVEPIQLAEDTRLLTSLDAAIIDQMDLPTDVRRIEIVSPFVDGRLEVLNTMRGLWPDAHIRLRLDPGFGALDASLLTIADERIDVLVPVEPKEDKEGVRRPAVHGKLICFVGDTSASVLLGSANLSRPALLVKENFEAVVERRINPLAVDKLLHVPHVRWRKAQQNDRQRFQTGPSQNPSRPLIAGLTVRQLRVAWAASSTTAGTAKIWCRGRCVFEQRINNVAVAGDRHCWEVEIDGPTKEALVGSCFAEVQLDDDRLFRGWIDVMDMLGVAPEAKRQLVLLDAIASDPLGCKEKDVVKFIELLQRNLKSYGRTFSFRAAKQDRNSAEEYDDTPIQRSLLLETGKGHGTGHSFALTQLLNRSLDTALRDLRFFGRDGGEHHYNSKQSNATATGKRQPTKDSEKQNRLPPKIGTVLGQLFGQLADAFDSADSSREVAELIAQLPTCVKALSYAAERWLPRTRAKAALRQYLHKVAISCLAPGVASVLHREGAIRRLTENERDKLRGGAEFSIGVAILEAYLLLDFWSGKSARGSVLKDMHDVVSELPITGIVELAAAGNELWRIQSSNGSKMPDFDELRTELAQTTGELATLRGSRSALHKLILLANEGGCEESEMSLAERASGADSAKSLLELIRKSSRPQLIEIESDESACPKCFITIPVAVRSQLNNSTAVRRCSCGALLVRSLDK